jgi:hypothetical protein
MANPIFTSHPDDAIINNRIVEESDEDDVEVPTAMKQIIAYIRGDDIQRFFEVLLNQIFLQAALPAQHIISLILQHIALGNLRHIYECQV